MSEQSRNVSQPAVAFGLTLLLIGLSYALPVRLVPQSTIDAVSKNMAAEVANVYACAAWAGWAHFLFAYYGQRAALIRIRDEMRTPRLPLYLTLIAIIVVGLIAVRWSLGPYLFGAIVWVYFIDHFLKAEHAFEGRLQVREPIWRRWLGSYQPLLCFGWLSVVLLSSSDIESNRWSLWSASLALAVLVLITGGWRKLSGGDAKSTLLCLFFIAEALVWGTFSSFGGPAFAYGVYVFHIAAGSYFHYVGSYIFASSKSQSRNVLLTPAVISAINAILIGLGVIVAYVASMAWLTPILGIEWFTLWVAVHLVSSDLFPRIKSWRTEAPTPAR